ncbi:MAG: hypothetical protein U9R27_04875 [Campylobacterota bacterium]|nr:hypothetical protein [Campylobacterota bacterium]
MSRLNNTIEANINILIKPLKSEEDLIPILRKRLTKKEYKLLQMIAEERDQIENAKLLNLNNEQYILLRRKLVKKLNQEKLKQELMV